MERTSELFYESVDHSHPQTGGSGVRIKTFNQAASLIAAVTRSGRKIIGFDLNEVAPASDAANEWDANVGARLLYQLCAWTLASQGKCKVT